MVQFVKLGGGVEHPVSDAFHARHVAPHGDLHGLAIDALEREKGVLMRLWNARAAHQAEWPDETDDPNPLVHHDERARVDACDALIALRKKAAHLGARDLAEFGFAGLDEFVPIAHHCNGEGGCGCLVTFVVNAKGERHPLRILKSCKGHAHLKEDLHAHQAALLEHNRSPDA